MPRSIRIDAVLVQAVIAGALSFRPPARPRGSRRTVRLESLGLPDLRRSPPGRCLATAGERPAGTARPGPGCHPPCSPRSARTSRRPDSSIWPTCPAWLRILVAGWPALAFLGGTLLVHTPADKHGAAPAQPVDDGPATPAESTSHAMKPPHLSRLRRLLLRS
ncbi:hypothetical protein LV779_17385 [Streptomyces thinghirensis]|nr:hypothetical protein [Streptomyces thinghirensis]